jgi:hypothetical protein
MQSCLLLLLLLLLHCKPPWCHMQPAGGSMLRESVSPPP